MDKINEESCQIQKGACVCMTIEIDKVDSSYWQRIFGHKISFIRQSWYPTEAAAEKEIHLFHINLPSGVDPDWFFRLRLNSLWKFS